jgi:hypothetical protein
MATRAASDSIESETALDRFGGGTASRGGLVSFPILLDGKDRIFFSRAAMADHPGARESGAQL